MSEWIGTDGKIIKVKDDIIDVVEVSWGDVLRELGKKER